MRDPEAFDLDYAEEVAILRGQALRQAFPDGVCATCRGTGGVTYYEDVCGDGGPRMQVWMPCPECIEEGLCPSCGGALDEEEYCLCTVCGFVIDDDTDDISAGAMRAAVTRLQEQALRAGKAILHDLRAQFADLPMPYGATVPLPDYDLEVGRCNTAHTQPEMWFWQAYRKQGIYPVAGSADAFLFSADEALADALWMTGYMRALQGAECREVE